MYQDRLGPQPLNKSQKAFNKCNYTDILLPSEIKLEINNIQANGKISKHLETKEDIPKKINASKVKSREFKNAFNSTMMKIQHNRLVGTKLK
jgi:hypothetical protein